MNCPPRPRLVSEGEGVEKVAEFSDEERALGFEGCPCDAFDAYDDSCAACGERVKVISHVHFKGQLFHDWCLLIAALRQTAVNLSPEEIQCLAESEKCPDCPHLKALHSVGCHAEGCSCEYSII